MPSITIAPPPRLTRPTLDSPLVSSVLVLVSSVASVDDVSSVSPSLGGAGADADASERGALGAPSVGKVGGGTVTGGVAFPALAVGVATVATGVVTAGGVGTFGFGTVGF